MVKNMAAIGFTQGRTQRVVFAQYEQKRKELHSRLGPGKKASVCPLLNKLPRRAFECNNPTDINNFFQLECKMENKLTV